MKRGGHRLHVCAQTGSGNAMTDDEFFASFEDCSLANRSFRHADHVRMAFLYLSKYSALGALQRFSASLAQFAAANGKAGPLQ